MDFNKYQKLAKETAIYPNIGKNYIYPSLGLANEVGELLGKIKKLERGDHEKISPMEFREMIRAEAGDVLWYLSVLCEEFKIEMDDVAEHNIIKLDKRQRENKLKGDGDNR